MPEGMEWGLRDYGVEGQIGLETTLEEYLQKLLRITSELKRVLKPTGVLFWNHGDCYGGSNQGWGKYGERRGRNSIDRRPNTIRVSGNRKPPTSGFRRKCMALQNYRLILRMVDEQGWILRNVIIWCIMEDMKMFVLRNNKYLHIPLKQVKIGDIVFTIDKENNFRWVRIKNKFNNGKTDILKIITKSGKEIYCSPEHKFPVKTDCYYGKYIKLRLKKAKDLTTKDFLWVNHHLPTTLSDGDEDDYQRGFIVGFFIAEGSFIKRKVGIYKDSVYSKSAPKRWGRLKKPKTVVEGVQFSCGKKDFERGYLRYLRLFDIRVKNYQGNSLSVYSRDGGLVNLVRRFVVDEHCDKKHFSQRVWNTSLQFIKGIIDGFLAGDGSFDEGSKCWRVRIKPNQKLKEDLMLACRLIGYEFRYEGISKTNYGTNAMGFIVRKEIKRKTFGFLYVDQIEKIERAGQKQVYDIEVEPIYTSYCGKGETEVPTLDKKKAKWNNLYFLANGIWTHNSKPNHMPCSVKDRFTNAYEPVFMLVKNNRPVYYYNIRTGMIQSKKPLGIKGKEGIDWEWRETEFMCGNTCEGGDEYIPKRQKISLWRSLDYWFDLDAVRVPHKKSTVTRVVLAQRKDERFNPGIHKHDKNNRKMHQSPFQILESVKNRGLPPLGKNPGDVWTIPIQSFPGSHFATFPERLVEPAIKAGCPQWICRSCGKPKVRITQTTYDWQTNGKTMGKKQSSKQMATIPGHAVAKHYTIGWTNCGCNAGFEPGIVLDPFCGSGTTCFVAKKLGRNFIGIDINREYCRMARERLRCQ